MQNSAKSDSFQHSLVYLYCNVLYAWTLLTSSRGILSPTEYWTQAQSSLQPVKQPGTLEQQAMCWEVLRQLSQSRGRGNWSFFVLHLHLLCCQDFIMAEFGFCFSLQKISVQAHKYMFYLSPPNMNIMCLIQQCSIFQYSSGMEDVTQAKPHIKWESLGQNFWLPAPYLVFRDILDPARKYP